MFFRFYVKTRKCRVFPSFVQELMITENSKCPFPQRDLKREIVLTSLKTFKKYAVKWKKWWKKRRFQVTVYHFFVFSREFICKKANKLNFIQIFCKTLHSRDAITRMFIDKINVLRSKCIIFVKLFVCPCIHNESVYGQCAHNRRFFIRLILINKRKVFDNTK